MTQPQIVERPPSTEYAPPFERYVSRVAEIDVLGAMARQHEELTAALAGVRGEAAERYRYAEGKWSIREVVGHVIDSERVFGYRAVCIARGESTPLPGFDENAYVANASFDEHPLAALLEELGHVRSGHLAFFNHLSPEAWRRTGISNANPISVRALAFIIVGHPRHHLAVLRERYLPHVRA
jgi:DinB superfamily